MLTLSKALAEGRLSEFAAQEEKRGIGPVYLAIEQQKPESMDDAEDYVMEIVVPGLAKALENEGWIIEEYASARSRALH